MFKEINEAIENALQTVFITYFPITLLVILFGIAVLIVFMTAW